MALSSRGLLSRPPVRIVKLQRSHTHTIAAIRSLQVEELFGIFFIDRRTVKDRPPSPSLLLVACLLSPVLARTTCQFTGRTFRLYTRLLFGTERTMKMLVRVVWLALSSQWIRSKMDEDVNEVTDGDLMPVLRLLDEFATVIRTRRRKRRARLSALASAREIEL